MSNEDSDVWTTIGSDRFGQFTEAGICDSGRRRLERIHIEGWDKDSALAELEDHVMKLLLDIRNERQALMEDETAA